MFTRTLSLLVALALATTLTAGPLRADDAKPSDEEVKAAQARVADYLKTIPGAESGRVTALTGDGLPATFPDHIVFAVLFPQYPVARVAPPPLSSANVVAVPKKKDGKPVPVTNAKDLEKFFKEHARPVKTAAEAEEAVKAWLRVAAELNQDGFYKFTVKADKPKEESGALTASGEAPVNPQGGNKGEVKATLTFKDGKLTAADTKAKLSPGIRPICQATKLLDPDPIVRGMAEQSIRVMGSAAKPYLDEQRAKASPELRAAIDRVWEKIVAEKR
jgi:hypothetical protein